MAKNGALLLFTTLGAVGAVEVNLLAGAGTTNPSKLFWETLGLFEARSRNPIHATYRAVGSSTGQKEFLGTEDNGYVALNHFGAGDIPMTSSRYASVVAAGRSMVHIPFAMGGIGVFHSAPVGGASVHLTACVLAKIFSAQITMWDDAEIAALNTDVTLPSLAIKVVHRVHGSSSTAGFTEYLESTCAASWTLGTGSTITWPTSTFEGQGSDGMSSFISANEGAIGYIDAGHGHEHGLSEIALQNLDGSYLTTLEADIGAAGTVALAAGDVIPTDPTADFSSVNLYNLAGPTTWPITMISYFYVEQDLTAMDPNTAALLYAFISFILSTEGQSLAEDNLFVGLPQAILDYNAATLATLVLPSGYVALTFETADTTQIWDGAATTVLSGKRQSFDSYAVSRLEASQEATVIELQATVASQAAQIAELQAALGIVSPLPAPPPSPMPPPGSVSSGESYVSSEGSDDDDVKKIAIAALAFGILAFLLAAVSMFFSMNTDKRRPVQREISFQRAVDGTQMSSTNDTPSKTDKV